MSTQKQAHLAVRVERLKKKKFPSTLKLKNETGNFKD